MTPDTRRCRRQRQQQQLTPPQPQEQQQFIETRIYLAICGNRGTLNFPIIFNNGKKPVDFVISILSRDKWAVICAICCGQIMKTDTPLAQSICTIKILVSIRKGTWAHRKLTLTSIVRWIAQCIRRVDVKENCRRNKARKIFYKKMNMMYDAWMERRLGIKKHIKDGTRHLWLSFNTACVQYPLRHETNFLLAIINAVRYIF